MSPRLAQREWALVAVALLAVVCAFAIVGQTRGATQTTPAAQGNYVALAGSSGPAAFGRRTACGGVIRPETRGVSHPTLPCGARIFISYGGVRVLTQVIDRGPYEPGRQFDLTDALARLVGLQGVQPVHWSYARAG